MIQKGIYQHYKGNTYEVVGIAKHSETLEDLVVYKPLYNNPASMLLVRPLKMFQEDVEIDGKSVPRFKFISSAT